MREALSKKFLKIVYAKRALLNPHKYSLARVIREGLITGF